MKILAVLLAIWGQKATPKQIFTQADQVLKQFHLGLLKRFKFLEGSQELYFATYLLLPLVLVALLNYLLSGFVFNLAFCVLFLVWGFGEGSLRSRLSQYISASAETRLQVAETELAVPRLSREPTQDQLHRAVRESLVIQTFNRFFSVMFWFVLVGPVGIVLVRLTDIFIEQLEDPEQPHIARNLQQALRWLPAKCHGFAFALVGDFLKTFNQVVRDLTDSADSQRIQLTRYVLLALGRNLDAEVEKNWGQSPIAEMNQDLEQVLSLVERARLVWLMALAVVVIVGW